VKMKRKNIEMIAVPSLSIRVNVVPSIRFNVIPASVTFTVPAKLVKND